MLAAPLANRQTTVKATYPLQRRGQYQAVQGWAAPILFVTIIITNLCNVSSPAAIAGCLNSTANHSSM